MTRAVLPSNQHGSRGRSTSVLLVGRADLAAPAGTLDEIREPGGGQVPSMTCPTAPRPVTRRADTKKPELVTCMLRNLNQRGRTGAVWWGLVRSDPPRRPSGCGHGRIAIRPGAGRVDGPQGPSAAGPAAWTPLSAHCPSPPGPAGRAPPWAPGQVSVTIPVIDDPQAGRDRDPGAGSMSGSTSSGPRQRLISSVWRRPKKLSR